MVGELLVDDRDVRCVRRVSGAESAAFQNREPHRVEEKLVHHRAQDRDVFLPFGELKAFRHNRRATLAVGSHGH
jgi:hypothetical protein